MRDRNSNKRTKHTCKRKQPSTPRNGCPQTQAHGHLHNHERMRTQTDAYSHRHIPACTHMHTLTCAHHSHAIKVERIALVLVCCTAAVGLAGHLDLVCSQGTEDSKVLDHNMHDEAKKWLLGRIIATVMSQPTGWMTEVTVHRPIKKAECARPRCR